MDLDNGIWLWRVSRWIGLATLVSAFVSFPSQAQTAVYIPPGSIIEPGPITQTEINVIADSTAKANAQARYDKAKTYATQPDGKERHTDRDSIGRPRLFYSPQKLTSADCLVSRHWEMVDGYAGCVCDGDTTHTRVSNDNPAACVIPPPPPPPPPTPPPSGGGSVVSGFTFGGLGSPMGSASPVNSAITGTWSMISNYGSSVVMAYSGNIGALTGVFSGQCTFGVTDFGGGNFGLNGPCGSGTAYSWGAVYIAISQPNYTGSFNGTFDAYGANGTITATLNSGIQMYTISRSGSTIGFVMMNTSTGTFNGYDQGNSISGYINSAGIGAINLGGGVWYAAMSGSGVFGSIFYNGPNYSVGGSSASFFIVDSGGGIVGTGSLSSIPVDDPGWATYFANNGLRHPSGFFALLALSTSSGVYYACTPLSNGATCFGPGSSLFGITSP